jgi:hypothetical protein
MDRAALRRDLIRQFAALPDEAFEFLLGVTANIGRTAGGFRPDSRSALEAMGAQALAYLEAPAAHVKG